MILIPDGGNLLLHRSGGQSYARVYDRDDVLKASGGPAFAVLLQHLMKTVLLLRLNSNICFPPTAIG